MSLLSDLDWFLYFSFLLCQIGGMEIPSSQVAVRMGIHVIKTPQEMAVIIILIFVLGRSKSPFPGLALATDTVRHGQSEGYGMEHLSRSEGHSSTGI